MPCYDARDHDGSGEREARQETRDCKKEVARLESMLCSACRSLEVADFDFDVNPMLSEWWDKHKKADEKRKRAEQQAADKLAYERRIVTAALKKPIEKLSGEEKSLLKKYDFL